MNTSINILWGIYMNIFNRIFNINETTSFPDENYINTKVSTDHLEW